MWIDRWRAATRGRVDYAPSQGLAGQYPEIPSETYARTVVLIEPGGGVTTGARAVFRALAMGSVAGGFPLWLYEHLPGAAGACEGLYRLVAGHRTVFSRLTRLLWGAHGNLPGYAFSRSIFLRAMGLIYLSAFVSLWTQVDGLAGDQGIAPIAPLLEAIHARVGASGYWMLPTLAWLHPGTTILHYLCGGGVLCALLLIAGVLPAPALLVSWAFYLSLTNACGEFLGFQWDNLLLETGFLAVFLAPLSLRSRLDSEAPVPRLARWLMWWLLFRLMFSSGVVKLASGDPTWRSLTALDYHYETQPLPIWTSWYVQKLPHAFQAASTAVMFVIELIVPFLIAAPRRLRLSAFWLLVGLQLLILFTGNYAFFNWLSLALCLLLVDDATWRDPVAWIRRASPSRSAPAPQAPAPATSPARGGSREWPVWVVGPVAAAVFCVSLVELSGTLHWRAPWPKPVLALAEAVAPLRTINRYGLFAVMTTQRDEIIVEGSLDGKIWLPYEFKWKPGALDRRPALIAPHQPRLDWQMWFAALGTARQNRWFMDFLARLLQGSPDVVRLLKTNPFPGAPPKYVRALLYEYHFSSAAERRASGNWWRREPKGVYCPPVSLRQPAGP
jgi:hypothetical protein